MPTNVNCKHLSKEFDGKLCKNDKMAYKVKIFDKTFKLWHRNCPIKTGKQYLCQFQEEIKRPTPPPPKVPHRHATPHKCTCPSPLEIVRFYTLAIDTLTFFPDDGTRTTEHNAAIAFFSKELVKMRQRGDEKLVQLMKETSK